MRWAASLDMYRKVPTDLLEGTKRGSVLSYGALALMMTLFVMETRAYLKGYFSPSWVADLALDDNTDSRVMVNFNITMMDLRCEWAVVDAVSDLGTQQNITAHVNKWNVDYSGIRQRYQGRNRQQHDIELFDSSITHSYEDLIAFKEDAISLDPKTFNYALKDFEFVFMDFYASWCSHCRDLAPTWETLAEVMDIAALNIINEAVDIEDRHEWKKEDYDHAKMVEKPVMIAKVDCVDHQDFCNSHQIRAYPTLRLFIDGKHNDDYRGHRTVIEMADWLHLKETEHKQDLDASDAATAFATEAARQRMSLYGKEKEWADDVHQRQEAHGRGRRPGNKWKDEDHPGCQIAGSLMLDRVPGNFHIMARSDHHDLVPHMTNASHIVHELSFGESARQRSAFNREKGKLPKEVQAKFAPMNDNVYVTEGLHEAYHHHLKVITTDLRKVAKMSNNKAYQIIQSSQLSYYQDDVVPEAKFIYDLSPIAVSYSTKGRHWYDYVTSLMAIIGGTFTVVGMMESGINAAVSKRRQYRR